MESKVTTKIVTTEITVTFSLDEATYIAEMLGNMGLGDYNGFIKSGGLKRSPHKNNPAYQLFDALDESLRGSD